MDPMIQEENNLSVRVKIFDQAYNLYGADPDYILKLADYVDSMMRVLAEETHTTDSEQLAVLAAVRIAAEYDLLKRKLDGSVSDSSMSNHISERDGWEEKMPEGEETEASGEEETTKEADSSDCLVGDVGQPRKPFTEEDRQRTRERRERHHTKRWYEKQLLAIANGDVVPTKEQHNPPRLWQDPRLESASAGPEIA